MTLFLIFSQYFSCSKKINKFEIYVQKLLQQDIFLLRNKKNIINIIFFAKKNWPISFKKPQQRIPDLNFTEKIDLEK